MIVIGLTGSIGMGKTTTAEMFKAAGVPVISADAIVHELYRGEAAPLIDAAFPGAAPDGVVDRKVLSTMLLADPEGFERLEAIIHPLVRAHEQAFLDQARADGHAMALVDIPLLYETGAENRVDTVVVASCAPDIQRQRVLARPGMSEEKFETIVSRQFPDDQKRNRADFVVDTGLGLESAREQVASIIAAVGKQAKT
jgi:dephospho-CoA kinase